MSVIAQRNRQGRIKRSIAAAADARQYATPWDDERDYLAYYEGHIDAYLANPDTTQDLLERAGTDAKAAAAFRWMMTDLNDRIRGRRPEGDLIEDMRVAIRTLGERMALLARQPICDECDYEDRLAADALRQMRRYGEVIE